MRKKSGFILNTYHHKKKQQSRLFVILSMLLLVVVGFYFYQHRYDVEISTAKLYFYDSAKTELVPITRKISLSGQSEKIVKILIEELSKPPKEENLQSFIPVHGSIAGVTLKEGICSVLLEEDMISDSISTVLQEAAAVYSIVNTLTELDSIQKVLIAIQGKKDPTFKQYISLSEPLISLSGQLPRGRFIRLFSYYLPANVSLVSKIEIPASTDLEETVKSIVNQLMIRYIDDEEITSFFPEDVIIHHATVENGVLLLDLSPEFTRFHFGANEELHLINCITLSLTELPQISQVKILINGSNVDTIGGHTDASLPYKRWDGYKNESTSVLYFVLKRDQNQSLVPVLVPLDAAKKASPETLILELLKGPSAHYKENGIVSDIPSGTKLISVSPGENNSLTVNLEMEMSEFLNAQQEANFIEQIVLTLTENTGFSSLHLYFNGEALESLPFGTEIHNPISREIQ